MRAKRQWKTMLYNICFCCQLLLSTVTKCVEIHYTTINKPQLRVYKLVKIRMF